MFRTKPRLKTSRAAISVCLALLILVSYVPDAAAGEMTAIRITEENAARYLYDCPDRIGGIGDWYLANDKIWAIIDDVSNPNVLSAAGGSVVDLGPLSHKGEQLVQIMPILNMTRDLVVPYDEIRAETGEGWAAITVSTTKGLRAEKPGFGVPSEKDAAKITVETQYRLVEGESFLNIKSTITNNGNNKAKIFYVGDIIFWGDDLVKPFGGSRKRLKSARGTPRGFEHPMVDTSSIVSIVKGIGGYTYMAGGGVDGMPPVSYGICSPSLYGENRLMWGITDHMVGVIGSFLGKFNRPFDLWKILFFGIKPGENYVYERAVVVGERNDVASATDTIFRLLGESDGKSGVSGSIDPPGAGAGILILNAEDETPITHIRIPRSGPDAGVFRAVLPPGKYIARIRSICRDPNLDTPEIESIEKRFDVGDGHFTDIGTIALPALSKLSVEVFEGGKRSAARVIIHGEGKTPDPELGSDLQGFTLGGKARPMNNAGNWLLLDGNEIGPTRVDVRPGRYSIYATRGFEHSLPMAEIDLSEPGSEATVRLDIERLIETTGMIGGDFHVHGAPSMDSAMSAEHRIRTFVAEGVELLIATDHDALMDYAPTIARMGLSDKLMSVVGVEATSTQTLRATPFTIGHTNAWPLKHDPMLPRGGMIHDEGMRPRELYDRLGQIADGEPVIQINHGRGGSVGSGDSSFFNVLGVDYDTPLGYDPALPLTESPNDMLMVANEGGTRDIDFDAMELLNGWSFDEYLLLRADWFSLLNQGYAKAGTANSDTHLRDNLAGYPRNYIILKDPTAKRAEKHELDEQIRSGRLFGTTGPIVRLDINGKASLGDTITAKDGKVSLNLKVLAVPWVPLDVINIYANGEIVERLKAGPRSEIVRFDLSVSLFLDADAWIVIEAMTAPHAETGEPSLPGGLYNIVAPKFAPIAFTNPIFVDVDGNGRFDPPGVISHMETR